MRCESVQRLTIFKADRPMNRELVSSIIASLVIKFREQLRAVKRKSQTTTFPSEVFTPSNQLSMWHFPVSNNNLSGFQNKNAQELSGNSLVVPQPASCQRFPFCFILLFFFFFFFSFLCVIQLLWWYKWKWWVLSVVFTRKKMSFI